MLHFQAEAPTMDILSEDQLRGFFVTWNPQGDLTFGMQMESDALLECNDIKVTDTTYIGLKTGINIIDNWEISGSKQSCNFLT
jgi:hypothetical protein